MHKLIEELLTGETEEEGRALEERAGQLLLQLGLTDEQDPTVGACGAPLGVIALVKLSMILNKNIISKSPNCFYRHQHVPIPQKPLDPRQFLQYQLSEFRPRWTQSLCHLTHYGDSHGDSIFPFSFNTSIFSANVAVGTTIMVR